MHSEIKGNTAENSNLECIAYRKIINPGFERRVALSIWGLKLLLTVFPPPHAVIVAYQIENMGSYSKFNWLY